MQGMQCLMCAADHAALAAELWCAMLRNPDYVLGNDLRGYEAHLMDFRANVCQLEYHTWADYPQVSEKARKIKLYTKDILSARDICKFELKLDIYFDLRTIWREIMELREIERAQDETGNKESDS